MIKTLIFDFGDVFINLDKTGALENALNLFEIDQFPEELIAVNSLYEQGLISTDEFIDFYTNNFNNLSQDVIIKAWNYILKDFPIHRFKFIHKLAKEKEYKLILLSNTNELHINWIKKHIHFYTEFKDCFDKFYLSHLIGLRKPNKNIFEFVLDNNNLQANECLFIDDTKENTETAKELGFNTWNIDESKEDVIDLFVTKKALF